MLDEVVLAGSVLPSCGFKAPDRIKLVVAGEDHDLFLDLRPVHPALFLQGAHEPADDVEEAVPLPDFLPEVGRLVAAGVRRVTCAVARTPVEGKKIGAVALQPRRHENGVRIYGKVDEGALLVVQEP